ncbi:DHA3 family multidrug efflux protein-like MFS transporter [Microbacterium terrae]|uniref:Major Facilitator Superfamily protein n=1 Tax=Microbacterium terrae TaxID=69369 RepID=A0A0M2H3A4_9MICO|nr:MFS transporter [Microbacterium terrae]KJL38783.1 Major Facilitator Superfamily protein [Microbacterium terrae]MBP1076202.1 DHA3 family multidrug efflux protein-like MFS transporter [Microbacterium terrae]GLJ97023.1 chloramphenicol efflux pump [Microbacterium terrae]
MTASHDPATAAADAVQVTPGPATLRAFYQVLVNTAIANVTSNYLWWALTFWAYLETRSVLATAIIGGSYMLLVALLGVVFGAIVDHMKKKAVMVLSSTITLVAYVVAGALYLSFDESVLIDWGGPWFWVFAGVILIGGVVENMRNIALSTTVTLLVPADRRDKANGLVGTVHGIAFMVTSVFSGLSVGLLGMGGTMVVAIALTGVALLHLAFVPIPERGVVHLEGDDAPKGFDFRGVIPAVLAVPGLLALILFSTFNNLVGGVFMALMDPYGLTLFSVEMWGVVLGATSFGFIIGGALVAKFGLGKNPVRTMLLVNIGIAFLGMTFAIREWWWLYALGILVFMCLMPIAEASEQTIVQRVVPFEKQGRVFGFAASVESAAAPISAFIIGPLAQFWLIPFMESDAGQDALGWLLGDGEARGIALAFMAASLLLLVAVLLAFISKPYRDLSAAYASAPPSLHTDGEGSGADAVPADAAAVAPDASDVRSSVT